MEKELKIKTYSFTIDCVNARELARFYAELLDWDVVYYDDNFAVIGAKGAGQGAYPGITFQSNPDYVPPVWPADGNAQQQMAHLDFAVNDLNKAVEFAVSRGARKAEKQFSDGWTVMLDPSGHPFCLCRMEAVFDSPDFALR